MDHGIFLVLTGVNLVFVLIALAAVRKSLAQLSQIRELSSALSNERGRIAAHDAELDQITATLRKLSGRIGAARKAERDDSADVPESLRQIPDTAAYKANLRARLGIVPGHPAPKIGSR